MTGGIQMEIYIYVIVALIGLIIGSFLNVCIYRIPRKESISFPPSHCFSCNNNLKPKDLFPVFSYIFLKGKCRYCGDKISIQYPLIETLNSLVYLLLFKHFGLSIQFVFYAVLASTVIVVSIIDYYHQIIPNKIVLFTLIIGIIYRITILISFNQDLLTVLKDSLLGFLIGGGFYLLIFILTRGNMGGGDIKLMAALGVWLGAVDTGIAIFLTFMIGALVSVFLLATKIKGRKDAIAFGPFIVLGTFMTILYKIEIMDVYLKLMWG